MLIPPLSTPSLSVSGGAFVVTGGTQGLGLAIAQTLKEQGAAGLVLVSRTQRQEVLDELQSEACQCHWIQADLSKADEATSVMSQATDLLKDVGPITGVVNAAATTGRGNLETSTAEDFDFQMAVNVRAPFLITQAAAQHMTRGGSIVNITSVAAHGGAPFIMAYSVSKAALVALTKNNAAELAPRGIRVNAVNMGWTVTANEDVVQQQEHSAGRDWVFHADAGVPLGRILRPKDVAATVCFLLSNASAMMTGSIIELHPEYAHGMISSSPNAGEGR